MPRPALVFHIYSPQRAAERAKALGAAVCNYCHAEPLLAPPCRAWPSRAEPRRASSTPLREQQGRLAPSVLPSATVTRPKLTTTSHNHPCPAEPCHCKLGLTPKDAQHDQATAVSIRSKTSVTGITSASNLPCFGLQSPRPTSLPASLAISSTSRKFNTSGSY